MTPKQGPEPQPKVKFLEPAIAKDLAKPKRKPRKPVRQPGQTLPKKSRTLLKAILTKKPVTPTPPQFTGGKIYRQSLELQQLQQQLGVEKERTKAAIARQRSLQQQKVRETLRETLRQQLQKDPVPEEKFLKAPGQPSRRVLAGYGFYGEHDPAKSPTVALPSNLAAYFRQPADDLDCCSTTSKPW